MGIGLGIRGVKESIGCRIAGLGVGTLLGILETRRVRLGSGSGVPVIIPWACRNSLPCLSVCQLHYCGTYQETDT